MISYVQMVEEVKQHIVEIEPSHLQAQLASKPILIDVREESEWLTGIIEGANCIPRGMLEAKISDIINASRKKNGGSDQPIKIYVYCRSGARSALAANTLMKMGVPEVFSLKGGLSLWQAQGLPVVVKRH